jgi:hypothetical protein
MHNSFGNNVVYCALALITAVVPPALADPDSIHERAIVIDTHSDYLYRSDLTGDGLADEPENAQTTLAKMRQGGMDAQFFSVWAAPSYEKYGYARKTLEYIDKFYQQVALHPNDLEVALTADDIRRISRQGKIAALMGIEGGHMIENRLALLRNYYRLGARYMTLRVDGLRPRSGAGDESAGHDGGRQPRIRRHLPRRNASEQGAGDRLPLFSAGPTRPSA